MATPFKNFTGSIDDLLKHCQEIDADLVERVVENKADDYRLSDEEAIDVIVEEFHCSKEEAQQILRKIQLEELDAALAKLCAEGLIEIVEYDPVNSDHKYRLTEKGKQYVENKFKI